MAVSLARPWYGARPVRTPPKPKVPTARARPNYGVPSNLSGIGQTLMSDANRFAQAWPKAMTQFGGGGGWGFGGGGGFTGGGGNPYADFIGGDYGVQDMESRMNARMGRATGDFQTQLRQALIDLGVTDASKLGNLGKYIDSDTISKAAANKYSQFAQIAQQEKAARAQSEASLAARGMLSSGALTKQSEDILAGGESGRYGALRNFLSAGAGGLTGLADLNEQLAEQLAMARFDAAQRAAEAARWNDMMSQQWEFDNPYYDPGGFGGGSDIGGYGGMPLGYSPLKYPSYTPAVTPAGRRIPMGVRRAM